MAQYIYIYIYINYVLESLIKRFVLNIKYYHIVLFLGNCLILKSIFFIILKVNLE